MDRIDYSFRALEEATGDEIAVPQFGEGASTTSRNNARLMHALRVRGAVGVSMLSGFEIWMISSLRYTPTTAKRKRRLVWGCKCDYPEAPWDKVYKGYQADRCRGANAGCYLREIRLALRDYAEWMIDDPESEDGDREKGREILSRLRFDLAEVEARIALRNARKKQRKRSSEPRVQSEPSPSPSPPPPSPPPPSPPPPARAPKPAPTLESLKDKEWFGYAEAAIYTGFSIGHLRNLVSADQIPHYDGARSRRFRRDMLDSWLTNRDAAMRKFRAEREAHHGD